MKKTRKTGLKKDITKKEKCLNKITGKGEIQKFNDKRKAGIKNKQQKQKGLVQNRKRTVVKLAQV